MRRRRRRPQERVAPFGEGSGDGVARGDPTLEVRASRLLRVAGLMRRNLARLLRRDRVERAHDLRHPLRDGALVHGLRRQTDGGHPGKPPVAEEREREVRARLADQLQMGNRNREPRRQPRQQPALRRVRRRHLGPLRKAQDPLADGVHLAVPTLVHERRLRRPQPRKARVHDTLHERGVERPVRPPREEIAHALNLRFAACFRRGRVLVAGGLAPRPVRTPGDLGAAASSARMAWIALTPRAPTSP
jgi:hypothetical protein